MKNFCTLIIILLSPFVWPCANVNLQTQEDSPLKDIPVYDQDGIGSCYSYAASVLMDFHRLKNGYGGLSNPLWLALKHTQDEGDESIEGGRIKDTINEVRKVGICKDDIVNRALDRALNENNISHAQFMDIVELMYELWDKEENVTAGDVYNDAMSQCHSGAGSITVPLYEQITRPFKKKNGDIGKIIPEAFLDDLFAECKGENVKKPAIPKSKTSCEKCTDSEMDEKIKGLLSGGQPVGISYCASVLYDDDYEGINSSRNGSYGWFADTRSERVNHEKDKEKKDGTTIEGCGRHASVIVGSRNIGGTCQYLLRNSWGSTSYSDHASCLCETSKGVYEDCRHRDGKPNKVGCWIDADELTANTYKLTHF